MMRGNILGHGCRISRPRAERTNASVTMRSAGKRESRGPTVAAKYRKIQLEAVE